LVRGFLLSIGGKLALARFLFIIQNSQEAVRCQSAVASCQLPRLNLHGAPGPWYFSSMGANEVLEHVKALPPRERRKFFAGVHELETALEVEPAARRKRPIRWPDAAARRRRISGDKVLPNLVLLAREQERY
jgi:hypothetical protein